MKKYLLLLSLLTLISCTSRQHKAEALVKHYLDSTLNDPSSYQSVSFSKVDSAFLPFSPFMLTKEYEILSQREIDARFKNDYKAYKKIDDSIKLEEKRYKPKFYGFNINHTFRAKTSLVH